MPKFTFSLSFSPTKAPSFGYNSPPITAEEKQRITALAAKLNPKPAACEFNPQHYDGHFNLRFVVDAETQFESAEIASSVSEQTAALNFAAFRHQVSNSQLA